MLSLHKIQNSGSAIFYYGIRLTMALLSGSVVFHALYQSFYNTQFAQFAAEQSLGMRKIIFTIPMIFASYLIIRFIGIIPLDRSATRTVPFFDSMVTLASSAVFLFTLYTYADWQESRPIWRPDTKKNHKKIQERKKEEIYILVFEQEYSPQVRG
ncbi:MAG TPA: hypothetical protein VGE63_01655 [Candidatus Paceibacterota bacterium]